MKAVDLRNLLRHLRSFEPRVYPTEEKRTGGLLSQRNDTMSEREAYRKHVKMNIISGMKGGAGKRGTKGKPEVKVSVLE